jgi:hypothetical protein
MSKQKEKSPERLVYEAAIATLPPCPKSVRSRTGNKVSWFFYATLEEAKIASDWAFHRAVLDASMGYDFGYCSPGSIRKTDDQLYEVCFP